VIACKEDSVEVLNGVKLSRSIKNKPPKATSRIGKVFKTVVTTWRFPEDRMERLLRIDSPQITASATETENHLDWLISGKKTPK
jgi:hypothetical protein